MGSRPCNDDNNNNNNEKKVKKQRHWLDVFAATNRFWQCISALILYAIFYSYFLMGESPGNELNQTLSSAIETLAVSNIIYHPNVLLLMFLLRRSKETRGWRFIAVFSIIGDLSMMFLALSKLVVLSAAGVTAECHGQEKTGFFKNMLNNGAAFARTRFGWGSHHDHHEPDLLCCLPKVVYLLCAVAVFSYTFSILFTGLQFQRSRLSLQTKPSHPGHIEEAIPTSNPLYTFYPPRPSVSERPSTEGTQPPVSFAPRQSSSSTRRSSEELPRYANPAELPFDIPRPRMSQETTSSFNPDLYLISDGFRPIPDPPTYSSRPPSYRSGPPSYRSRPSSIHNA
ncbi:hypothetical protein OQA88_9655 [Cercophora sp. LCS_1]